MNSWAHCSAVERDPARVSGAWVFTNTRVPVRALFENLEDGANIDEFIKWFPGVTRKQAEALPFPVPPLIALLDAYQSSFQIWYVSNILRNRRMCKKYLEGRKIN